MMLTICIHISHHIHFRKVKFHENYSKSIRSGNQHTDVHLLPWSNCLPLLSTALICRSLLPKHSKARRTSRRRKRPQRQRPRLLLRSKWSCKRPRFVWASFCWVIQKILKWIGEWWLPTLRTHADPILDFPKFLPLSMERCGAAGFPAQSKTGGFAAL